MLNKILLSLCLLFPGAVMAQEFDASVFQPIMEQNEVKVNSDLDIFKEESEARIAEMRRISQEFKEMAEQLKQEVEKLKEKFLSSMPAPEYPDYSEYVTRDEVLELVREEVSNQVKVAIRNKEDNSVRTEVVNMVKDSRVAEVNSVKISGYSGTFNVRPGEFVVAVDGVPVKSTGRNKYGPTAQSNNYLLLGQGRTVRVVQPSNCRVVNGRLMCN